MRQLGLIALLLTLAIPAFPQRGGARGGGGFRGGGGMSHGSGGFRGGAGVSGFRGGYGGVNRGGINRGGIGFRGGFGRYGYGRFRFSSYNYYPFYFGLGFGGLGYWPGYYGGYDPYFDSSFYAPSGYASYYPPEAASYTPQAPPVVIVNEGNPYPQQTNQQPRYEQPADQQRAPAPYQPTIYSIAFRDGRVLDALAYWVLDRNIHYVTLDHAMHQAPLGDVDRGRSEQLNRDKRVDFRLPAQ